MLQRCMTRAGDRFSLSSSAFEVRVGDHVAKGTVYMLARQREKSLFRNELIASWTIISLDECLLLAVLC